MSVDFPLYRHHSYKMILLIITTNYTRQMSGSNYHVSDCQVLESERALKLSNVPKLYNRQGVVRKDRASFMEFLNTFSSKDSDSSRLDNNDLTLYSCVFSSENIDWNTDTKQALAFITGYASFSLLRKLSKASDICLECTLLLTKNKSMEVEEFDSTFALIQILDRGGLK